VFLFIARSTSDASLDRFGGETDPILGKCACDWATGSHSSTGCNLQLLLDWSWNRVLVLKQNGDSLTICLFDHAGDMLDRNSVSHLDNCVRQLGQIANLYNIIIEKCSSFILPESK
jgi:hypothetical protein